MITLVVEGARPITFPLSDSDSEIVAGQALSIHHGNVKKAAAHLKVTTFGLRKMMKRLGIEK